jgi:MFS family permease
MVLAATVLASAMAFIDGTVVMIALPIIQTSFQATFAEMQWVVNAYTLMLGALILVAGALGDRLGRRLIFVIGILIFAAASLLCALAPNAAILIAGRAVQGIGGALLVPQSLAIIAATFPQDVRGRAIGFWAAASAITTSLGPPLGGFLIDTVTWRVAFLINLPLSAAAL